MEDTVKKIFPDGVKVKDYKSFRMKVINTKNKYSTLISVKGKVLQIEDELDIVKIDFSDIDNMKLENISYECIPPHISKRIYDGSFKIFDNEMKFMPSTLDEMKKLS